MSLPPSRRSSELQGYWWLNSVELSIRDGVGFFSVDRFEHSKTCREAACMAQFAVYCCDRHQDPQWRGEEMAYFIILLKGHQKEKSGQRLQRNTAYWTAPLGMLVQFRTLCPRAVPPTAGWPFLHQSFIKKMPYRFAYQPIRWQRFLDWNFILPGESSLCQVDKDLTSIACHFSNEIQNRMMSQTSQPWSKIWRFPFFSIDPCSGLCSEALIFYSLKKVSVGTLKISSECPILFLHL